MKQIFTKNDEVFMFFTEYYKYLQEYAIPEADEQYWSNLVEHGELINQKYGNNPFYRSLIVAFIHEVERKWREQRNGKN